MIESLIEHFTALDDPRCAWRVEHRLVDVLVLAVCAVVAEAETFEAIELYGRCKESWLQHFLKLPGGIPSHDTFHRVLMLIDPDAFKRRFLAWVRDAFRAEEGTALRSRSRWTAKQSGTPSIASTTARGCIWSAPTRPNEAWRWRNAP